MIAVIFSILVFVSMLLSAFVFFTPNFKTMVESDLSRKALENAADHGFKIGQLLERSGTFPVGPSGTKEHEVDFELRAQGEIEGGSVQWEPKDHIHARIRLNGDDLSVELEQRSDPQ